MNVRTAPLPDPGADTASRFREETHGRHYPALDGLRGLAFLAVFGAHVVGVAMPAALLSWGGWLGVDLFFVLSGFLITGILYDSLHAPRYFRNFYIRRALRIFPLYYSVWIVFLLLTPWLHPLWTRFDIGWVFYVANLMSFSAARHPEINATGFFFYLPGGHLTGFNVGHLWSLCLEEQFYLVWPLLVFLLRDRRRILVTCVVGIGASLLLNGWLQQWAMRTHTSMDFLYVATYAHISPMLFGAALAMGLRGRPASLRASPWLYGGMMFLGVGMLWAALGFLSGWFDPENPLLPTAGYFASGLAGAGLVLGAVSSAGWLRRALSARPLRAVGRISYGMYVIHGFLLGGLTHRLPWFRRHHLAWLVPVLVFAVTYALASLSYRWLERPFLRLKDRWAPTVSSGTALAESAGPTPETATLELR